MRCSTGMSVLPETISSLGPKSLDLGEVASREPVCIVLGLADSRELSQENSNFVDEGLHLES